MFTVFAAANLKIYGHRQAVNLFAFHCLCSRKFEDLRSPSSCKFICSKCCKFWWCTS